MTPHLRACMATVAPPLSPPPGLYNIDGFFDPLIAFFQHSVDEVRSFAIPYHTIPYHTIPYHTIPYHTIPYHTMP
jgi:hypothetical protein